MTQNILVQACGLLFLTLASGFAAQAAKYDCQPDTMTDAEADRIYEIATRLGRAAHLEIRKFRSSGATLDNDVGLDLFLEDREGALFVLNEMYERTENKEAYDNLMDSKEISHDQALLYLSRSYLGFQNPTYIEIALNSKFYNAISDLENPTSL